MFAMPCTLRAAILAAALGTALPSSDVHPRFFSIASGPACRSGPPSSPSRDPTDPHSPPQAAGIRWQQLSPDTNSTSAPARRSGAIVLGLGAGAEHSHSQAPYSGAVLLHGGCSSSCCYAPLQDIWAWTASSGWTNVSQSTSPPSTPLPAPRLYHTATPGPSDGTFYVYGGADAESFFGDFWSLQVSTSSSSYAATWTLLDAAAPPGPRSAHVVAPLPSPPGSFLLYGGFNSTSALADVWMYTAAGRSGGEVSAGQWTCLSAGPTSPGDGPGARVQASATAAVDASGNAVLVVMGGTDESGNDQSDVWAFSVATQAWYPLGSAASGGASWPLERHGHSVWSAPSATEGSPFSFYVFGGQHGSLSTDPYLGDLWAFSVPALSPSSNGTFVQLQAGTTSPSPSQPVSRGLGGVAAAPPSVASPTVYCSGFSGYDGGLADLLHNDVWSFSAA
jgi:hypothetical protein